MKQLIFALGLAIIATPTIAVADTAPDETRVHAHELIAGAELPALSITAVELHAADIVVAVSEIPSGDNPASAVICSGSIATAVPAAADPYRLRRSDGVSYLSGSFTTSFHNHRKRPHKERGVSPGTCRITGIDSAHDGNVFGLRSSLHLRP